MSNQTPIRFANMRQAHTVRTAIGARGPQVSAYDGTSGGTIEHLIPSDIPSDWRPEGLGVDARKEVYREMPKCIAKKAARRRRRAKNRYERKVASRPAGAPADAPAAAQAPADAPDDAEDTQADGGGPKSAHENLYGPFFLITRELHDKVAATRTQAWPENPLRLTLAERRVRREPAAAPAGAPEAAPAAAPEAAATTPTRGRCAMCNRLLQTVTAEYMRDRADAELMSAISPDSDGGVRNSSSSSSSSSSSDDVTA